jgi:hypothetical protein
LEFVFKLRPADKGQLAVFRELNEMEGFTVAEEADGYHHVTVQAASFDDAQIYLRDTLATLGPPEASVAILVSKIEQKDGQQSDW